MSTETLADPIRFHHEFTYPSGHRCIQSTQVAWSWLAVYFDYEAWEGIGHTLVIEH